MHVDTLSWQTASRPAQVSVCSGSAQTHSLLHIEDAIDAARAWGDGGEPDPDAVEYALAELAAAESPTAPAAGYGDGMYVRIFNLGDAECRCDCETRPFREPQRIQPGRSSAHAAFAHKSFLLSFATTAILGGIEEETP